MNHNVLKCIECSSELAPLDNNTLICRRCSKRFSRNSQGYFDFANNLSLAATSDDYAALQIQMGDSLYSNYLKQLYPLTDFRKVLDVGCGMGQVVSGFLNDGYEAFGCDLTSTASLWKSYNNPSTSFLCADICSLPFVDNYFDLVTSFGVIEHIGTVSGHCTLRDNYQDYRRKFASEISRVTRPGGKIVISCPNKHFLVDVQHGAMDEQGQPDFVIKLRDKVYRRTGINFHPVWGDNHLLSYSEIRQLFSETAQEMHPLSLKNFFRFSQFRNKYLRPFMAVAQLYVDNLPTFLRETPLNPYVILEVTKKI